MKSDFIPPNLENVSPEDNTYELTKHIIKMTEKLNYMFNSIPDMDDHITKLNDMEKVLKANGFIK